MMRYLLVALLFIVGEAGADSTGAVAQDRWQKISRLGKPIGAREGPWACILDRRTGLVWENKTDNEGVHFEAATYSWRDADSGQGVADRGSCVRADATVEACDTADLVTLARRQAWCGLESWRLPSGAELGSLLYDTGFAGNPLIAIGYFPHTGRFPYWTRDTRTNAQGEQEAFLLHFGGRISEWLPVGRAARVRLVAEPAKATPTPER